MRRDVHEPRVRRATLVLPMVVLFASAVPMACKQERHDIHPAPARPALEGTLAAAYGGTLTAAYAVPSSGPVDPYRDNGYGMSEGNRLFQSFNCIGCHAHGGGGIGPALMDRRWLYGSEPREIFRSIAAGRPRGMPAFGPRLTEDQIWQLVAYVRSLAGLAPAAEAPGRTDDLSFRPPESRLPKETPLPAELPSEGTAEGRP